MERKGYMGQKLGRYKFVKILGSGSFGTVMGAKDTVFGVPVAIKHIRNAVEDEMQSKLLLRELKLLRHFRGHENVIGVKDIFVSPEGEENFTDLFIVTHLMDTDLAHVIQSSQTVSNEHVRYFVYQILRGLKFIHSAHVMHRDLKPQNLLVNRNCDLRICDLGLARLSQEHDECEQIDHTVYVVTRWYRAPELLLGQKGYDMSIDLWSVGCILAELLARHEEPKGGRCFALFPGSNYVEMLRMQVHALGRPELEDQQHISDKAKAFLAGDRFKVHESRPDWKRRFPQACDPARDLLIKLLQFNPKVSLLMSNHMYSYVCFVSHTALMHGCFRNDGVLCTYFVSVCALL